MELQAGLKEDITTIAGVRTRYVAGGSGPALLFLHGFGEFLEIWWYNLPGLSRQFSVYALDFPGHGKSDSTSAKYTPEFSSRFVLEFMDVLGIERAHLVGHSLGCVVCLRLALDHPDKLEKLVLVDGGLHSEIPFLYRLARLPALGDILLKPTMKSTIRYGLRKKFYNPEIVSEEWVNLSYGYLKSRKMKETLLSIIRTNVSAGGRNHSLNIEDLGLIKTPTLIVHGKYDSMLPLKYAETACRLIPGATLKVFAECGHNPHIEKPAEFNEALIGFISKG